MAEEQDPGKSLMTIGFIVCLLPVWTDSVSTLWPLFIVGPILFLIGLFIKVAQSGESVSRSFAVGIHEHLPTSKGVDFLERVVNIADNPDTSTMAIGQQPVGTRPTMEGILENQYEFDGGSYSKSANQGGFAPDSYDEFAVHGHERVLPLLDRDPVAGWYNPQDEWQNPVRYW